MGGKAVPDIEVKAQSLRLAYHTERGRAEDDIKAWDDLPEEKRQRWIDKANGED
jgi:hypothetical protein